MKNYLLLLSAILHVSLNSQTLLDLSEISTYNQANSGDVYKDSLDNYYLGMDDGRLKAIGNVILTGNEQNNQILRWNASQNRWVASAARVFTEQTIQIPANGTEEYNCPASNLSTVFANIPVLDNQFTPSGVIDPGNISTNEGNLINGNLSDLVYNNRSAGTINKALPAVNLGSSRVIAFVRIYWYTQTYGADAFVLQGSNNGTTWTNLTSSLATTEGDFQDISVSGSYQYIRLFCQDGIDNNWVVLSEMQVFGASNSDVSELILSNDNFKILESTNGTVAVQNNGSLDVSVKVFCQE